MAQYTSALPQFIFNPGYISGYQIGYVGNTTFTVQAGNCLDSTNSNNISMTSPVTVNMAINGLNGLDTGTFQASKSYAIYVVNDPTGYNQPGCIASLSLTQPIMPAGLNPSNYTQFRRIGWIISNGATQIIKFAQFGTGNYKRYQWDGLISVLSAGVANAFTAISCAAAIPPLATFGYFTALYTPAGTPGTAFFRPTGFTNSVATKAFTGVVAGVNQEESFDMACGVSGGNASIDYKVDVGNVSISIGGFDDYL